MIMYTIISILYLVCLLMGAFVARELIKSTEAKKEVSDLRTIAGALFKERRRFIEKIRGIFEERIQFGKKPEAVNLELISLRKEILEIIRHI